VHPRLAWKSLCSQTGLELVILLPLLPQLLITAMNHHAQLLHILKGPLQFSFPLMTNPVHIHSFNRYLLNAKQHPTRKGAHAEREFSTAKPTGYLGSWPNSPHSHFSLRAPLTSHPQQLNSLFPTDLQLPCCPVCPLRHMPEAQALTGKPLHRRGYLGLLSLSVLRVKPPPPPQGKGSLTPKPDSTCRGAAFGGVVHEAEYRCHRPLPRA
jgi:hypothetical protein